MAESYECFKVDVADFVATVRLSRPPVNAQNRRFREEIISIFDALSDRPDVRAVVLTGEGKTFSAGADLKERPGLSQEIGAYAQHNRLVRESFNAVMECEKPIVAAINGAAIGAGCVLALCCDILIASEKRLPVHDRGRCGPCRWRESRASILPTVRRAAADLYGAADEWPGSLPDGRSFSLRVGRRASRLRNGYRARYCGQESPCRPGGKALL